MALIHTCYRITDIDRSVAFYKALGFEEVGRIPIPQVWCPGFSRSCAATPWATRSSR